MLLTLYTPRCSKKMVIDDVGAMETTLKFHIMVYELKSLTIYAIKNTKEKKNQQSH